MPARRTRQEVSLDRVLGDVERGREQVRELRENLHLVRQGYLPPERFTEPHQAKEREQAELRRDYIESVEAEIARIEGEIEKAWAVAGGLSDAPDRLPGSDEEIAAQAEALEARREALVALRGRHREDRHDAIDALLAEHVARFEALVSSELGAWEIEEAGKLWAYLDPALAERLHAAVDARPESDFAQGSRATWKSEIATLRRQAERRRKELALRQQEREAREAEARRAEAELALAETT